MDPPAEDLDRSVRSCRYRVDVRGRGDSERAHCELLRRLFGLPEPSLCAVAIENCRACCGFTEPTVERPNPTIAALAHDLAEEIERRGGVPGCGRDSAKRIRESAVHCMIATPVIPASALNLERAAEVGVAERCVYFGERLVDRSGGRLDSRPTHRCAHPDHDETTADACRLCRDWSNAAATPRAPISELVPAARVVASREETVRSWAVGVTTAPRRRPTVDICLDSLIRAGWETPRLFMDSPTELDPRHRDLPVSLRAPRVGAWPNYFLALSELLMREPHADAYMLVQDDVVFYDRDNLREYLERVLWPIEDVTRIAAISLYCAKPYSAETPGWHALERKWVWGALAFIFPRESAKRLVSDRRFIEHRWSARNDGRANIDVSIGAWAHREALEVWFPTPSLVQHIGDVSTLWPSSSAAGMRRADRFAGDLVSRFSADRVSVVIPLRDRGGPRLRNALASLRWQSVGAPGEIIVVSHGSTAETDRELAMLCVESNAKLLVAGSPNEPWSFSRACNIGIRATDPDRELVMAMDADVILAPGFLATALDRLDRKPRSLVLCQTSDLSDSNPLPDAPARILAEFDTLRARARLRGQHGCGGVQIAPRAFFFEVRGYDEDFERWGAEDEDMRQRAEASGLAITWISEETSMLHQAHRHALDPGRASDAEDARRTLTRNRELLEQRRGRIVRNPSGWGEPGARGSCRARPP